MFENITTLEELKKAYRAAAMAAHPDRGGSTEKMQAVNAAYEKRFDEIKAGINAQAAADPTGKTRTVSEMPQEFMAVISKLIVIPDIVIELCGSWVWVSGETKDHKDEIKKAGCFWAKKKGMWYWRCAKDAHHAYKTYRRNPCFSEHHASHPHHIRRGVPDRLPDRIRGRAHRPDHHRRRSPVGNG